MMLSYKPTESQKLIWLDQIISKGSAKYNIGGYASLDGELSYKIFNDSIRKTINSQEVYLSVLKEIEGDLIVIARDADPDFTMDILDFSGEPMPEKAAIAWMENDFAISFDMADGDLFSFKLLRITESMHFWYAKVHHIISDGWSFKLLLNQTADIYDSLYKNNSYNLPDYKYSDYALDDENYYHSGSADEDREFWLSEYASLTPELFSKRIISGKLTSTADSETLYLSPEIKRELQTIADANKISLFHIIITLLLLYFSRTRKVYDIAIGTPVLNRSKKIHKYTAGIFMNLLSIKFAVESEDTFLDILYKVKHKMHVSLRHQKYQYGSLLKDLKQAHAGALYDIRVSYEDFDFTSGFGGLKTFATALSNHSETDKLSIYIRDYHTRGFDIRLVYNTSFFDKEDILSICRSLQHLITNINLNLTLPLDQIGLLDREEQMKILNCSVGVRNKNSLTSFLGMWEDAVMKYPANIAISCRGENFAYADINFKVNILSKSLAFLKKDNNAIFPLLLPKSEMMIVAMLACIKSNICYLPLDPEYPEERIRQIIRDTGCKVLIKSFETGELLTGTENINIYNLETLMESDVENPEAAPCPADKDSPCYIIYTSGSTGVPKGVIVPHRAMVNYIYYFREYFKLTEKDIILQQSAISFDTSVEEIFPILSVGGRLHIPGERKDIVGLAEAIVTEKVSVLSSNPHVIRFLNQQEIPASLRIVISGGDVLWPDYINNLVNKNVPVYNTYGPTEATVCATYYKVKNEDILIPIGSPIDNAEIWILDDFRQLQPLGVEGEIFIGGDNLAIGYVNDPRLTSEKFIAHPFDKGKKLYKTGDMGIMMPDGNVLFKGRRDNQLNYRGYRIEAYEIEKVIKEENSTDDCIVEVRDIRNTPILAAYIKYKKEDHPSLKDWRIILKGKLPAYMIPEIWIELNEFPLSLNGKIDRNKLAVIQPDRVNPLSAGSTPLQTDIEKRVYFIWNTILQLADIGREDSFFDLGGHSLNITQLINQYSREFNVRFSLYDLFHHTTIAAHAALIEQKPVSKYTGIKKIKEQKDYDLSDGQQRIWIVSQQNEASGAYCLHGQLLLKKKINTSYFERSVQTIVARHEILRTVFRENIDGEVRQLILPDSECPFRLDIIDFGCMSVNRVQEYINGRISHLFEFSEYPLWQAVLIRLTEENYLFHFDIHHIISDGWSMELISQEIMKCYNAFDAGLPAELPALHIQYKDYAAWQQEQVNGNRLSSHRNYWMNVFSGELPIFDLPITRQRPPVRTYAGHVIAAFISKDLVQPLRWVCRQYNATLFMGLLTTLKILLYRYSGRNEMIIGCPVAGRNHAELENQIGFYVNTLALRSNINGNETFIRTLENVRDVTLSAYEHQDYPFDRLVGDLKLYGDMSRSALFDVMVILQNQQVNHIGKERNESPGDEFLDEGDLPVKFDLSFDFYEIEEKLYLRVEYNTDLYEKESILNLIRHYKGLLMASTGQPEIALDELEYMSEEEKDCVLKEFNQTNAAYDFRKTIVNLFREQVIRNRDYTAVVFADGKITYEELDRRSDQLAYYLHSIGIKRGDLVPLCMDKSFEMIVGIIGTLKAGGVYVPIDPLYPKDRISLILEEISPSLILICNSSSPIDRLMGKWTLLPLDEEGSFLENESLTNPVSPPEPEDLAYIIYTSGSSGYPKGVMIEHSSVVNLSLGQAELLELKPGMGTLLFSSVGFDASCYEIFNTLLSGGFLVIPSGEQLLSPESFIELIQRQKVQVAVLPPAFQPAVIMPGLSALHTIISAGESLNIEAAKAIQSLGINLVNAYGPTETTVCASLTKDPILKDGSIIIGKPVPNTQIYILDKKGQPLPVGIEGELCIAGAGLARGYLNRQALTEESFVYNTKVSKQITRLYKTKDLAKWLPDGNIQFLGRIDDQIKVRGYRIEPGEIEHCLLKLPGINNAIVIAGENEEGYKYLAAYLEGEIQYTALEIRKYLLEKLPEYMIPSYFIQLEKIPLTTSGKIDKKALPLPHGLSLNTGTEYLEPRNATETALLDIFRDILRIPTISIRDNFFSLGGNSLLLIKIRAGIVREFGLLLSIRELYRLLTVEEIAEALDSLIWLRENNMSDSEEQSEEISI